MRFRTVVPLVIVLVVVVVAALYLAGILSFGKSSGSGSTAAPDFTVTDIYGQPFTLSHYRSSAVVVVEFTSISCSECQIVEQSLKSLYTTYNATGNSTVQVISIYIEPQYGDSIPALKNYHNQNNITWWMAQDTTTLDVSRSYGVSDIPTVVVVDKQDHPVYDVSGVQNQNQLKSTIDSALVGTAQTISLISVSVVALAALAGVSTFSSPCAFPMFPGYMSLYLGLDTNRASTSTTSSGGSYRGALRRALSAGSVSAAGMMVVFLIIGVALVLAASVVGSYIPYLLVIVGVVLVALGILLLTNLQYWRIVTPIQALWRRMTGRSAVESTESPIPTEGRGFYLKLFSYGMGYAAAAAGCVAPVILSAIVAGLALGLVGGIVNILIYSLTAAVLMIVVTVALAVAGRRYVNQLKALTPLIKKVTAVVLIVVGVYLVYFFYTAWVA